MKSKALLLVSLVLAVAAYIAASYTPGHAQTSATVRVREVSHSLRDNIGIVVTGRIVGFSCLNAVGQAQGLEPTRCFVATTD
jgi:hypothetical protein